MCIRALRSVLCTHRQNLLLLSQSFRLLKQIKLFSVNTFSPLEMIIVDATSVQYRRTLLANCSAVYIRSHTRDKYLRWLNLLLWPIHDRDTQSPMTTENAYAIKKTCFSPIIQKARKTTRRE